jgi:hypothetical protein
MNVLYQESIHSQRATNERVSSLFFLLSLILHTLALCLFLIAGFRAKQRAASDADTYQLNPFSLTALRGRPSQVFFDNRPVSPAIGAPQGMAMPTGAKPAASPCAKPVANPQPSAQKRPAAKRKAAAHPKAIAQPKLLTQPSASPSTLPRSYPPTPLEGYGEAGDGTSAPTELRHDEIPIAVAAAPSADRAAIADQPLDIPLAQTPATERLADGPITDKTEPTPAPNLSTEALAKGDDSTVVFSRHAGQQAASKGTDGAYVANARRNLIAMTKGFIERTDIDELEDTIATDGQGNDEETCQGDAKREATALEFSLYRSKVDNQYVSAWHEHFSHLPIKQMYQAHYGLMFNDAIITYTLSREGKLLACTLVQSTGSHEVDQRILKSFELAIFPPFPRHFTRQTFTFTDTIRASHLDGSERFLELVRC